MAYKKRILEDGKTIINKDLLDHMQDGIAEAHSKGLTDGGDVTLIIPASGGFLTDLGKIAKYLFIRCPEYSDTEDFVWWLSTGQATNRQLNIQTYYTVPKDTDNSKIYVGSSVLKTWNSCSDDTAPVNFNGSYIAGNHGATLAQEVVVSSHDKTEADIGSIWTSNSHIFMLVKVASTTKLWFVQTDSAKINEQNWIAKDASPSGTLVHISGATHTSTVTISSVNSSTQLTPAINNRTVKIYVDDEEIDVTKGGVYVGKKIQTVNEYNTIYIPAMLEYLSENIGKNTNTSFYSDDITEGYCRLRLVQEIHSNASMTVYQTIRFDKQVSLSTNFIAQFGKFTESSDISLYIPNTTNLNTLTTFVSGSGSYYVDINDYAKEGIVPYRYYAFANDLEQGSAIIFDKSFGIGADEKRIKYTTSAGGFASTGKLYPQFVSGQQFYEGTMYDGCAVRIPFKKRTDITSVVWYWRGKDIILCIDSHTLTNTKITLPSYMANKKIEILDKSDSVITELAYVWEDCKLPYATKEDYGFIVMRLYN